jgi:thiol:disulfide interchange protein
VLEFHTAVNTARQGLEIYSVRLKKLGFIAAVSAGLMFALWHTPVFSKEIHWQPFAQGIARGKNENKKIFVHFYADWCGACRIMETKTFTDPDVIAYLNEHFIPIKVNADREPQTSSVFRVRVLPDNWFITESGEPIGHQPGYLTPQQMKIIFKALLNQNPAK